jgi:hypothetical protein
VYQLKRLHYILFHSEGALTEFFLGIISLVWGLWVLSPWWNAFDGQVAFAVMQQIAPEWVWGCVMTIVGVLKVATILSEQPKAKQYVFLVSLFVWSCVAISFVASSPFAVGSPIYILFVFANAFCIWRTGGKA